MTKDLVGLYRDIPAVTSLQVAKKFGKRHDNLLQVIAQAEADFNVLNFKGVNVLNLLQSIAEAEQQANGLKNQPVTRPFIRATYKDTKGEIRPMYWLTRDGFSYIVMGFTGKKAAEWKWKFIAEFNHMEKVCAEKATPQWQQARLAGKITRRTLTDAIKALAELAEAQGHHGTAKHLYSNVSRLVKKHFGQRDTVTGAALATIETAENMLTRLIDKAVAAGQDAKEVYLSCRDRIDTFAALVAA